MMQIWEIILIGLGLSMDAVAVSMTNGMVYQKNSKGMTAAMPLAFGGFQALMPLVGFYAGGIFAEILNQYAGILILLILGVIGGKMVYDGVCHKEGEECPAQALTYRILVMQAIATSIDAFAVGVGFSAMQVEILPAVLLIGLTTFICSWAAIFAGRKFGDMLGCKAEILGGVILIVIGIKAIFS